MPSTTLQIENYYLMHSMQPAGCINNIAVFDKEDNRGNIEFYKKGEVPASLMISTDKRIVFRICCENDRFHDIITTLRYEKPVKIYISWIKDGRDIREALLTTGYESPGEQEGSGVPPAQ